MPESVDERELLERLQRMDTLIDQECDPAAQSRLTEVVQTLLEFHRMGLQRIMHCIEKPNQTPKQLIKEFCADSVVSNLLVLHSLHPLELEARVRGALEKCGPYLASHGGHVELVSIKPDGQVQLRLEGSCHGCPSSRVTLQSSIEQEIYTAAPEVTSIAVEGLVEEPVPEKSAKGFVPLDHLAINGTITHAAAS